MRHTNYRRLESLIIGASEKKAKPIAVRVKVDAGPRGNWQASTLQVNGLIDKMSRIGGAIQCQRTNGDWERIYRFRTNAGISYGCDVATGRWFQVVAIREVL